MSAAPQAIPSGAERVALRIDDPSASRATADVLRRRGVYVAEGPGSDDNAVLALASRAPIGLAAASDLADLCLEGARQRRPVVVLAAWPGQVGDPLERSAALGYLRSFGAIICADPSTWIETLVLVSRLGLPLGPRMAIVATPGSLIASQAHALGNEHARLGARFVPSLESADGEGHDAVLVDVDGVTAATPTHVGGALVIPVTARGELATVDRASLVELRHATAAVALAGRLAVRIDAGLGPGPEDSPDESAVDRERFSRQLAKLGRHGGDHETKVLLSSYGIEVSRQAVAMTPSAAARIAKRAGFPVDIKAWGPEVPSEAQGCPVENDILTAADVRRAFAAAGAAAGLENGAPVIVRASPPDGRELRAELVDMPDVGWMVHVHARSRPRPISSPAPLSERDADVLASAVVATREGDHLLDSSALAELLVRASYLVWNHGKDFESLELGRIVLPDDGGALVVDAACKLRR